MSRCAWARRVSRIPIFLAFVLTAPAHAQLVVKLSAKTVSEFEQYVKKAESEIDERWQGKLPFLALDSDPAGKQKVLAGDFDIRQLPAGRPIEITDGLIHDWAGDVYIPHTNLERVLDVLRDFDNHKKIYPEVTDSRTIHRSGNDVTGYWRLQRKGVAPVTLEVEQNAHYQQAGPGKWICRAYARKIIEVDTGLSGFFTRGRRFPLGEGHGYMWRLYAYWSLESFEGGVLAECRTISLSRDIPPGLSWAVAPYVQKMPEESLASTLRETGKAARK